MAKRAKDVDLLRVVDLLQEHITPALCRTVFGAVRKTERQRVWTLEALIRFWTAVVLRAPKALSQALVDSLEGRDPSFPRIGASPEAFFQRCRDLRPAFFAEVFRRFTARLVTAVPPRYATELAPVQARFGAVVVFDGSRLAAIAHRLKLLWDERAVVLPGCLLGAGPAQPAAGRAQTPAPAPPPGAGRPAGGLAGAGRLGRLGPAAVAAPHPVAPRGHAVRGAHQCAGPHPLERRGGAGPLCGPLGHRADVLRSQGGPQPQSPLRGQPQCGGHAGLRGGTRLQRLARRAERRRRPGGRAPRGPLAGQALPQGRHRHVSLPARAAVGAPVAPAASPAPPLPGRSPAALAPHVARDAARGAPR